MASSSNEQSQRQITTGYDCSFVDNPPENVQSDCPVCLLIVRDPHQVTCCGYSFCQVCIQRIDTDKKPCPTCNTVDIVHFPDKRLTRSLSTLKVRCSHQKEGCGWMGELREMDDHLNIFPSPDKQSDGCVFVKIACSYCKQEMSRQHIQDHQKDKCEKRPFNCEHCTEYKSNYADVVYNHWPMCPFHPLDCPSACGSFPQRQYVEDHLTNYCPLSVINCDFNDFGCKAKLTRKDMPGHLKEKAVLHTSLLASKFSTEFRELKVENETLKTQNSKFQTLHSSVSSRVRRNSKDVLGMKLEQQTSKQQSEALQQCHDSLTSSHHNLKDKYDKLSAEVAQLKIECQALKTENKNLQESHDTTAISHEQMLSDLAKLSDENGSQKKENQDFQESFHTFETDSRAQTTALREENKKIKKELKKLTEETSRRLREVAQNITYPPVSVPVGPTTLAMRNYLERKEGNDFWISPPVYTHQQGYKVCLRVYANGTGANKDKYVSVYVSFMEGEYDYKLKWPFRGTIYIQLLSQHDGIDHKTCSVTYDDTVDSKFCSRVRGALTAFGNCKIVDHKDLCPKYLRNNILLFQVFKVDLH